MADVKRFSEASEAAQRHVRELQAQNEALLAQLEQAASRSLARTTDAAEAGSAAAPEGENLTFRDSRIVTQIAQSDL